MQLIILVVSMILYHGNVEALIKFLACIGIHEFIENLLKFHLKEILEVDEAELFDTLSYLEENGIIENDNGKYRIQIKPVLDRDLANLILGTNIIEEIDDPLKRKVLNQIAEKKPVISVLGPGTYRIEGLVRRGFKKILLKLGAIGVLPEEIQIRQDGEIDLEETKGVSFSTVKERIRKFINEEKFVNFGIERDDWRNLSDEMRGEIALLAESDYIIAFLMGRKRDTPSIFSQLMFILSNSKLRAKTILIYPDGFLNEIENTFMEHIISAFMEPPKSQIYPIDNYIIAIYRALQGLFLIASGV